MSNSAYKSQHAGYFWSARFLGAADRLCHVYTKGKNWDRDRDRGRDIDKDREKDD